MPLSSERWEREPLVSGRGDRGWERGRESYHQAVPGKFTSSREPLNQVLPQEDPPIKLEYVLTLSSYFPRRLSDCVAPRVRGGVFCHLLRPCTRTPPPQL